MGRVHQLPSCRYCFHLRLELDDPNYECARCLRMRLNEVQAHFARERKRRRLRFVYGLLALALFFVLAYLAMKLFLSTDMKGITS